MDRERVRYEQSRFFFRFREGSARVREGRNRETRETRAVRAWSITCLARCARRSKKKERLVVV